MVRVVAKKKVAKEKHAEFLAIASEMVALTRKEDGCIEYTINTCKQDENLLVFLEAWESQAHLDAHMQTEHFKTIGPKYNAFCDSSELMIMEDAYQ
ncbi:putative quinol monooxygenase [Bengtsoniella intestinalis]|uniref:putative quinol monooxygenase n=1 Tax=Bengtsoniella intestinalis TaxID=3073143 RepID=UPI00391F3EA6